MSLSQPDNQFSFDFSSSKKTPVENGDIKLSINFYGQDYLKEKIRTAVREVLGTDASEPIRIPITVIMEVMQEIQALGLNVDIGLNREKAELSVVPQKEEQDRYWDRTG